MNTEREKEDEWCDCGHRQDVPGGDVCLSLCAWPAGQPPAALAAPEFQCEGDTLTALAVIQQSDPLRAVFGGLCNTLPTCIAAP